MAEPGRSDEVIRSVPEQRAAPDAPSPAPPPLAPRRRIPLRRILLFVVLGVALAVVGAAGYGFILYDQATRPDRSAPDVAVDNYLRALLVERDDVRTGLYRCDEPDLGEIQALRDDMVAREQQFDISIRVTWGSLAVQREGDAARVTTELVRTISDGSEQSRQQWRFEVVDRDGWRVCGATRIQ